MVVYLDLDDSIPDDDELHAPHFGDGDEEESTAPESFDYDMYEGEEDEVL